MVFIQVCGDDDLESVAPQFLGGLYTNLVAQLRCDLARLKALIPMPSDVPIVLAKLLLGEDHLLQGNFFYAVDGGNIVASIRLFRVLCIGKDIEKILQVRRCRLRRIFYIFN